mmetsp:Transcript_19519/g.25233  ORF Transcript_19519/g.25233 Transcript_19519/m.25233 type:complete len:374 (+) Transcript_19519:104-1225(+)
MALGSFCLCGMQLLLPVGVGLLVACAAIFIDFQMFKRKSKAKSEESAGLQLPSEIKLLIAAGGIYGCYLSYGVMQEKIFTFVGDDGTSFTQTLFLLLMQCVVNSLVAGLGMLVLGTGPEKMAQDMFAMVGATYIGAMLTSNESLKHVNYPTQALGKSCKMIPVMLFGVLFAKQRYSAREYLCVLLITAGIAMFQLSGKTKSTGKENSYFGLFLLFVSLACDGLTGSNQTKLKQKCTPTVHQMMFFTNMWAVVILTIGCVFTGQLMSGFSYVLANPGIWNPIAVFSITSALGQNFIFFTVSSFNPLVVTTITTTRKFFTVLFSVFAFGHKLTTNHWIAVSLVFAGITGEVVGKYQKKQAKAKKAAEEAAKNKDD